MNRYVLYKYRIWNQLVWAKILSVIYKSRVLINRISTKKNPEFYFTLLFFFFTFFQKLSSAITPSQTRLSLATFIPTRPKGKRLKYKFLSKGFYTMILKVFNCVPCLRFYLKFFHQNIETKFTIIRNKT